MTQEINQQELQEFREWCGFKPSAATLWNKSGYWMTPDKQKGTPNLPPLDPNNLIKYAVPKMRYVNLQFSEQYSDVIPQFSATASIRFADNHTWADNDPAQALYQAIQKARGVIK